SRGMKITDRKTPSDGAISEKSFYLSGDEEYDYSVFVRHEGQADETFKLALGSQVIASAVVPFGKWVELAAKYTAPQNPENLTISITTNSTADFIFDNFKVTQEEPEYPIFHAPYDNVGLKDIYANYFRVGNILNSSTVNNTGIRNLVIKEYNSITAENEMKPDATMNRTGSTNTNIVARINNAAAILNFCAQNNIPVRGHVLAWHGQTPDWFFIQNVQDANWNTYRNGAVSAVPWATAAVMNQRLESYIKNLFALYQEQYPNTYIYAYDVVNEAVYVSGSASMRPAGFDHNGAGGQGSSSAGNSPWQAIYGTNNRDWITNAFSYARKYAPAHTKLFYNDYNEWDPVKRDYIIANILKPLREAGTLDGMGMQSHVSANPNDSWSGSTRYLAAMDEYAKLNIEIQATELDPSTNNGQYASTQPGRYKEIFERAMKINDEKRAGKFTAIVIWTPNDANTWLNSNGNNHTPALHDASNNRKAAYDAVAQLVPESKWGNGNNPGFVSSSSGDNNSSSSSSGGSSNITIECNVNNLQSSYISGSQIPRPNATCSNGTPGTASFSASGNAVTGWNSPNGTHALYNTGTRNVTLNSLVCGSTTVTPSTPISCGSINVVAEISNVTATCNVDNLDASYIAGAAVPRPNVDCSSGTPGIAEFRANGSLVTGWDSPNGTHRLYNTGERDVTLSSIECGSTTVVPSTPILCGSFIVEATTVNITVTCNLDDHEATYMAGAEISRPNVICSSGEPGAAEFQANDYIVLGWNSPDGKYQLYDLGIRDIFLNNVMCGATNVLLSTPLFCGSFEIVEDPAALIAKTPSIAANAKSEIYDLRGNKVSGPLPSGVYIEKKRGAQPVKFIVR
ncbi:MAG: endo-1,4-beta-xylanase, partial [Fibromonadales bacterium]|nr:endo-1,4-beta-xylanase [Fibromonadales bacterium]